MDKLIVQEDGRSVRVISHTTGYMSWEVDPMIDWCTDNLKAYTWVYRGYGEFVFSHKRDATLFILKWS